LSLCAIISSGGADQFDDNGFLAINEKSDDGALFF
jgi:hypothetical protein